MQARISAPVFISGGVPSLGALLGTAANSDVIMEMNSRSNPSFFSSRYDPVNNAFMRNHVEPLRQAVLSLEKTVNETLRPDRIIKLDCVEDFSYIPQCMQEPILTYAPVRKLLEQGRIDGFGWDPSEVPKEDDWGRYLTNGVVEDIGAVMNRDTGEFNVSWDIRSYDRSVTLQELDYIKRARQMIDHILEETDLDPTSIENSRG